MPKGPQGQKRPADTVQSAIMGARIATGEITETPDNKGGSRKGGLKGGMKRAETLSAEKRSAIAQKGATARWKKRTAPAD
jgi:hypothetical protein